MKSLLLDNWRYILNGDGQEELYDVAKDRWELGDVSNSAEATPLLPRFRDALLDMLSGRNT